MSIPTGNKVLPQLALACSKSMIETLEKFEICSNLTIKTPERCPYLRGIIMGKNRKKYI